MGSRSSGKKLHATLAADDGWYIIRLRTSYIFLPAVWADEQVILGIKLVPGACLIVQISVGPPDDTGVATIVGTGVAGRELARCQMPVSQETLGSLQLAIAAQADHPLRSMRLVLPNGSIHGQWLDTASLADIF